MWWWIRIGGLILFGLYMLLFLSVGFRTIGNGHSWLFVMGIFFPLFWLIGAVRVELVCSPRLLEADCRTIEEMRLVNALCRFVELAAEPAD